jgi:RHS repeat-associated protein
MRDERGSITSVSDSTGTLLARNRYDEYGIPDPANLGRFGYTGQTWLPEIGMWYYRARIYSPTLGRFLQTDPIGYGDGMNMYAYVGGDPVNFVDPLGLAEVLFGLQCNTELWIRYSTAPDSSRVYDPSSIHNHTTCDRNGSDPYVVEGPNQPRPSENSFGPGTIVVTAPIPRGSFRPLLPSDLGPNSNVIALVGEIGIFGSNLNIGINYIEGARGRLLRLGVQRAVDIARSLDLRAVNIYAIIANEQLGRVLYPQSSLFREYPGTRVTFTGPYIQIRIPVRR